MKYLFTLLCVAPLTLLGFSTGPPARRTGATVDGGINCTLCHRSFAPNSGQGRVTIFASPYRPGVKQNITVRVEDPQALRWGFELTARLKSDDSKTAGVFTANDETRVVCDNGAPPCNGDREFATHTQPATRPGTTGSREFTVEWTPPDTDQGDVIFYAAGNAANNSGTNVGDYIYTTKAEVASPSAGIRPTISTTRGVLNAASFQPPIAQNTWVAITGTGLSASTRLWVADDFQGIKMPIEIEGVRVLVNNRPAFIYYVSPTQINALLPADDTVGPVEVVTLWKGIRSSAVMVSLQRVAPAFFLFDGKNVFAARADGSSVGPATVARAPARPGDVISLYAIGLGATDPVYPSGDLFTGTLKLATAPAVRIGASAAEVQLAEMVVPGLYRINIKVPDNMPDGDAAVVADLGGTFRTQDGAVLSIRR